MAELSGMQQAELPICEVCEPARVFDTHRGLASHMKKHQDSVQCPFCRRPVRYLEPHLRKEHADPGRGREIIDAVVALVEENETLTAEVARARAQGFL